MRWSWFDLKSVFSGYCLKSYLENRGLKVFFKINLLPIANDVETLTRFIHVHARKFFTTSRTFHYQIHHLQVTLVPELISLMSWFFQITFKLWLAIVSMLVGIKADEIYWVASSHWIRPQFLPCRSLRQLPKLWIRVIFSSRDFFHLGVEMAEHVGCSRWEDPLGVSGEKWH